jgi:iron complex transport system ATP-binding protein
MRAEGLSYTYPNGHRAFEGVSFDLAAGEVLCLLGPNGSGKSTLLNCLSGVFAPTQGEVWLEGVRLREFSSRQIARRVAYARQTGTVSYAYRVVDYVAMGRTPHLGLFDRPHEADLGRAREALAMVGAADLEDAYVTELSGGQLQLANVARAVAQEPRVILLDEPTSALDYGNQIGVLNLVRLLARKGYAVVMTTHNPDHPILLKSTVAVLGGAGGFAVGPASEVVNSERLSSLYGTDLVVPYVEAVGRRACVCPPLGEERA